MMTSKPYERNALTYKSDVDEIRQLVSELPRDTDSLKVLENFLELLDSSLKNELADLFELAEFRLVVDAMGILVSELMIEREEMEEKRTDVVSSTSCFKIRAFSPKFEEELLAPLNEKLRMLLHNIPKTKNGFFNSAAKWYLRTELRDILKPVGNRIMEIVLEDVYMTGSIPGLRPEPDLLNTLIRRDIYPDKTVGTVMGPAHAMYSSTSVEFVRGMLKLADFCMSREGVRIHASVIHDEYLKENAAEALNYCNSNFSENPLFRQDLTEPYKYDVTNSLTLAYFQTRKKRLFRPGSNPILSRILNSYNAAEKFPELEELEFVIRDELLSFWLNEVSSVYREMEKLAFLTAISQRAEGFVTSYNTKVNETLEKKENSRPQSIIRAVSQRLSNLRSKADSKTDSRPESQNPSSPYL